jgi:hypothetical protein
MKAYEHRMTGLAVRQLLEAHERDAGRSCTSLDHVYPHVGRAPVAPGTPCACGRRRWPAPRTAEAANA